MAKKRSIVKLSIIVAITLIGLFLTFFSFIIPATTTTFKGFFNAINYGYDVDGGVLAVYEPYDKTLSSDIVDEKLEVAALNLNESLGGLGFYFTKQNDTLRLEISNTDYSTLTSKFSVYNVDVLSLIGSTEGLTFSSSSTDAYADGYVDGSYVKSCEYSYSSGADSWYITVNFSDKGKELFKELTSTISSGSSSSDRLYMYVDGEVYNSSGFEIESAVSSLTLTATSQQAAEAMSMQISALAKPILLDTVFCNTVTAGLNTSNSGVFGNIKVMLIALLAVLFVASLVFLCVKYRTMGAMATISALLFIVVYSFLLQSIPLVLLDINGIIGVIMAYVLLYAGMISIFEKIKGEYQLGKKVNNSVASAFKKSLLPVIEKYAYLLIPSAIFYIVGTVALKALAVSLFVGLFVNYFILFVVLNFLIRNFLNISASNKTYNLTREELNKDEI